MAYSRKYNVSLTATYIQTDANKYNSKCIMIQLLKENAVWICPIILAVCAVITLIYNIIFKKDKKNRKQNISGVNNSTINQAGRDINNAGK